MYHPRPTPSHLILHKYKAIGGATIPQMHLSSANFACNPMPPALHREVAFLFSCPPERGEFSSPIPLTLHDRYYFDDVANDRMRPFQERARWVLQSGRGARAVIRHANDVAKSFMYPSLPPSLFSSLHRQSIFPTAESRRVDRRDRDLL